MDRPWARGLDRLLADRRLKKGDLADLSGVRPGTISAVANSPRPPEIPTLMKLLDGFTKYDRQQNPAAPAVELWQFFVSDEQAAMLAEADAAKAKMIEKEQSNTKLADLLSNPEVLSALTKLAQAVSPGQPAPQPAATMDPGHQETPPAATSARGRLRRHA